jgi:hypothetical protein
MAGEPYFCTKCGHRHVRGKVYADHRKYARKDEKEAAKSKNDENERKVSARKKRPWYRRIFGGNG